MDQPVKEEDRVGVEKDISREREASEPGEEETETRNGFQEEEEVEKQEEKESKGKKGKHGGGRIKRPMNAFMVWSSLERKKLAEKEPNLHNTELSKRLGQMWKEMSEENKAPYRQEATRLKDKLMEDHPEYKYKPRRRKDLRHIQASTGNVGLFGSHGMMDRSYSAPPIPPLLPSSTSLYPHYNPDLIDGRGGQTHYPYYHSTPTSPHHMNGIIQQHPHIFAPQYYHHHLGGSPPAFQIGGGSNQLGLQQHSGQLAHLAPTGAADVRLECTIPSVSCDSPIPTGLVTSTCFQFPDQLASSSPTSPTSPPYVSETPPCSPYMPSSTISIQSYSISESSNTTQVTTSPRDACSPTFMSPAPSSSSPYPLREPYYSHFRYPPDDFIPPPPPPNYATSPLHMAAGREGGYMYDAVPPTLIKMEVAHNMSQHPSNVNPEEGDCTCSNYPVMAAFPPSSPLPAVSECLPISPDLTTRKPSGTESTNVFF